MISLLVTLCLSNVVESCRLVSIPPDGLSSNSMNFSIGEQRSKIVSNGYSLPDLLNHLSLSPTPALLIKNSPDGIAGIYASNTSFTPQLISGRTFSTADFSGGTDTALVSEDITDKCVLYQGKPAWLIDNHYFEVIGVYKRKNTLINPDARVYYNLASKSFKTLDIIYDNYIFGDFSLDAGPDTALRLHELDLTFTIKEHLSENNKTFVNLLVRALSVQGISLLPILLLLVLVVINSVSIASNWIESRSSEILIRRISGASRFQISRMLCTQFTLLVTLSFIPALILSLILSQFDLKIFYSIRFSLPMLSLSFLTVLCIGLFSGMLTSVVYMKTSLSHVRR